MHVLPVLVCLANAGDQWAVLHRGGGLSWSDVHIGVDLRVVQTPRSGGNEPLRTAQPLSTVAQSHHPLMGVGG